MVQRWCSDTVPLGSQYSRVRRDEKPLGKCGLNGFRAAERVTLQIIRLFVEVRILTVSSVNQTYVA